VSSDYYDGNERNNVVLNDIALLIDERSRYTEHLVARLV
jgi:hypothetical protein